MLALGVLAALAFVPLFLAVANLTRHTLRQNREEVARSLGRAVAGRLAADLASAAPDPMLRDVAIVSLDALPDGGSGAGTGGGEGVVAIRVTRIDGLTIEVGHEKTIVALRQLQAAPNVGERTSRTNVDGFGPILAVEVSLARPNSHVQVALRVGDQVSRSAPLLRLVAFYTVSFAVVLIVFAYLLLTRLIVRPVRDLVIATRAIEAGASRRIDPRAASRGAAEVVELGAAIARTTARLVEREEALAAKVRQLEAAKVDLLAARDAIVRSERLASVGRLAAGLAHEVGNPIAALLGLEEVLLTGEIDEETRDLVTRMRRETERVHRVMRDLLDFARAEQELSPSSTPSTASVREIVDEVFALVAPQKAMRDVTLTAEVDEALPPVRIAGGRLQQVLLNLVLNAADAIGEAKGGVGRITIHASRAEGKPFVRVTVTDDGPGVPERIRTALFEPFVTTKEVGKGTGLGLAVCRGLIEGAGGTIALQTSEQATGASFVLDLPTPDAPAPIRSVLPPPMSSR